MTAPYRPRVLRVPLREVTVTARQAQCLDGLCDGLNNAEIAAEMGVDLQTVKSHLVRLYRALGATGRVHAVGLVLTHRVRVLVHDPWQTRSAA